MHHLGIDFCPATMKATTLLNICSPFFFFFFFYWGPMMPSNVNQSLHVT